MKTNEEIKANLLSDYGWDLNIENELFPFVRFMAMNNLNLIEEITLLKSMHYELDKKVSKDRTKVYLDNPKTGFWYGYGELGFPLNILMFFCLIGYGVYKYDNFKEARAQNLEVVKGMIKENMEQNRIKKK